MNWARTMALVLCGEQALIAVVYAFQGNFRMTVYWSAVVVIGLAVAW